MNAVAPLSAAPVERTSLPALISRERARRLRRRWLLAALGLLVVGAVGAAVLMSRPRPVPLAAQFRTAPVTRGLLTREVRATGRLDAVVTVAVGAEISGRIASVEADFNQHVTAGQVLARFDVVALEAQRAQSLALALNAKAMLEQARSDLEQARRNRSRADQLFTQGAQTELEHENAVTALSVAQSRVAAAEASVAAQNALSSVAKTNLDHAVIRAPIDGIVITRAVDPGQTVSSMLTAPTLFTVAADLRKMEVLAAVDEADIAQVQPGQRARFTVTGYPGRSFDGEVSEVRNAATVVQDVVTYGVVVQVDNLDLALRPGMTASVRIETGSVRDAVLVPASALRFVPPGQPAPEGDAVWTLEAGRLTAHPVHPGLSDGEQTVITDAQPAVGTALLVDLTPEGKKLHAAR